ncbi:uncharacterized protein EMH_0094430 [Eimeria mitis]|uniref:Uncharacterized protein n=1 Tax=Eimeria mitis TaxID=44415 RepID=U6KFH4_9EIME|nr:uncharacterized protein EMH_0094430 [Eimeria mitis]CDJ34987.1 hypothetical protein EMH_0094430 [Eimeria mitis]
MQAAWGDLRVGNIVRVYCGECVPADLLILTCGHSESAILDLRMAAWGDLRVGNIVRVYCGECVPADLLILTCGHSESAILDLRMVDGGTAYERRKQTTR